MLSMQWKCFMVMNQAAILVFCILWPEIGQIELDKPQKWIHHTQIVQTTVCLLFTENAMWCKNSPKSDVCKLGDRNGNEGCHLEGPYWPVFQHRCLSPPHVWLWHLLWGLSVYHMYILSLLMTCSSKNWSKVSPLWLFTTQATFNSSLSLVCAECTMIKHHYTQRLQYFSEKVCLQRNN